MTLEGFAAKIVISLATYLIRHASLEGVKFKDGVAHAAGTAVEGAAHLLKRNGEGIGRLGGGIGQAMEQWVVEGYIYIILMSVVIGIIIGYGSMHAIKFALNRKLIDSESFLLWPMAVGLFTIGVCGMLGTDDLLACFVAGNALNWNGLYLEEADKRHDEVNSFFDVILNFGGFMYIGTISLWEQFHMPDVTSITIAIFMTYKVMPRCVKDWKEALFMGYFGPIGIGAVFYVEHTRHLFPKPGEGSTGEEDHLTRAMVPVVYWLVLFSIIFHGLSIPALDAFYRFRGVQPIVEADPAEVRVLSDRDALPSNAYANPKRNSVLVHNRFSRPVSNNELMRWHSSDRFADVKTRAEDLGYVEQHEYMQPHGVANGNIPRQ